MLFDAKLSDDIFHHHNRTVDDQAKIDRTKAHQVSRNAESRHSGESEEKGQRNRSCDDESSAPVAEEKQQHRYHEQSTFEKIRSDCANRSVHQIFSVVFRADDHAGG